MAIKTIPFSRLEADLKKTLDECATTGEALVVEMPDHRLVAIHAVKSSEDDSLIDDLLANNHEFRSLVENSKRSSKHPFKG